MIPYIVAAVGLGALVLLAWNDYARERRVRKMEEELPRAMLELSALPVRTIKDVVRYLSDGFGVLSTEMKKMGKMIEQGVPPEKALASLERDTDSYIVSTAFSIILSGYRSGANWSDLMRKTAEDLEAVEDMERQKRASLSLQKYVTLLSGGVFVPTVLGLTNRMTMKLLSGSAFQETVLVLTVQRAMIIHIVLLATLTSLFVALLEGKIRKALQYVAVLLPLSLSIYLLAGGQII